MKKIVLTNKLVFPVMALLWMIMFITIIFPKEMDEVQGCIGKTAYLEERYNPFSIVPEEIVDRIEIESIYKVCFGIRFYGLMHYI